MESERALIILVDDDPANLRIGSNVLEAKYDVATAPSAAKLFSLLENNNPAIILLDIMMPEMNGYEVIKILKSNPQTKNIPVIFLTARSESDDELEGLSLGAVDYITKPFKPALLLKHIEIHLMLEAQRITLEKQAAELEYFNNNLQRMVEEKTKNILNLQDAMIRTIAEMVEYRDNITGSHIERTQRGIKILLEAIKKHGFYSEEAKEWEVDLLLRSSQLHDVGKISINDNILRKTEKLNEEEFEDMKRHTVIGEQIIDKISSLAKESDLLKYAKIFASSHHEKWDGTGYHRGLKEDEIPLLGRIMAIADVYDALVSDRSYKKAFSHEDAVRMILEERGKYFDPFLVDLFLEVSDDFKNQGL
jgi:putative two-component system response regulator